MDQNTARYGSLDLSDLTRYVQQDGNASLTAPAPESAAHPALPVFDSPSPQAQPNDESSDPRKIKKFQCPDCGSMHQSPANLKTHQREKHTGEKPFQCLICQSQGKLTAFARKWAAERHICDIHHISKDDVGQYMHSQLATRARRRAGQFTSEEVPHHRHSSPQHRSYSTRATAGHTDFQQHGQQSEQPEQQQQPPPPPPPPMDIECNYCPKRFQMEDSTLLHEHLAHDVDPMPDCECSVCQISHAGDFGSDPAWFDTRFYAAEWRFRPQLYEDDETAAQHAAFAADFPVWDEARSL